MQLASQKWRRLFAPVVFAASVLTGLQARSVSDAGRHARRSAIGQHDHQKFRRPHWLDEQSAARETRTVSEHSSFIDLAGQFERGSVLFRKTFTPSNGLGPEFNGTSCASCHNTPTMGGSGGAHAVVDWVYQGADDQLGSPGVRFRLDANGNTIPLISTTTVRRRPPTLFGIGLLGTIPDEELRSRNDPFDDDHDGISGRLPTRFGCVARFGWQSTTCDIDSFVVWALSNELGILSTPKRRREISDDDLAALVAYVRQLPAPPSAASSEGSEIFERVLCAKCHIPFTGTARQNGRAFPVRAYTDLLLHEMGSGKRDGERASRTEFRTPPLWGVGTTGPAYLHDGSAK